MKIIYGKNICILEGSQVSEIVIKYRGNPILSHKHLEITDILNENQVMVNNGGNLNSMLIHGNNQIHIGFKNPIDGDQELFKYSGYFKILTAKINNENVIVETQNIDYWNKVNSTWNSAGKPESYYGTYQRGKGAKNIDKNMKRLLKKALNMKKGRKTAPRGVKRLGITKGRTRGY